MKIQIFFLLLLFRISIFSQIVINEIMPNVKGLDSGIGSPGDRNEFIEIYNNSSDSINLTDWFFYDGSARDFIIEWNDSLIYPGGITNTFILPPYSYGIILDPEYTEIGDSVYYMLYTIPDSAYVFTINNTTFTESGLSSADFIYLCNPDSIIIDEYGTPNIQDDFPYDPGDGISMEKKNFNLNDNAGNWSVCSDSTGNTIGRINSNFINGAIIDSIKRANSHIYVYINIVPNSNDNLIIEYFDKIDTLSVEDSIIQIFIDTLIYNIVNIKTEMENKTYSIIMQNDKFINSIMYNEFMVSGIEFEWLELFNPYELDFYINNLYLVNNDTVILIDGIIPSDSYIVISKDTNSIKAKYGITGINLMQCDLFSLPDREDSFLIIYNNNTLDSVIRGYEDMGYISIEKINDNQFGYIKYNWDNSVSDYGATPGYKNSLAKNENYSTDNIFLDKNIVDNENPILYLNVKSTFDSNIINIRVFNVLGLCIEQIIYNKRISGETVLPLKININKYKNDVYIMNVELQNNEKNIKKKILFAVRK